MGRLFRRTASLQLLGGSVGCHLSCAAVCWEPCETRTSHAPRERATAGNEKSEVLLSEGASLYENSNRTIRACLSGALPTCLSWVRSPTCRVSRSLISHRYVCWYCRSVPRVYVYLRLTLTLSRSNDCLKTVATAASLLLGLGSSFGSIQCCLELRLCSGVLPVIIINDNRREQVTATTSSEEGETNDLYLSRTGGSAASGPSECTSTAPACRPCSDRQPPRTRRATA